MPTNKLPLLGGGERELRLGDRVRLGNGIELTPRDNRNQPDSRHDTPASELSYPGFYHPWVDASAVSWWPDGKLYDWQAKNHRSEKTDFDIVLILGPESVDNGDGTVTKVLPLAVTMRHEQWERLTPQAVQAYENASVTATAMGVWMTFQDAPTPQPSPFVKELVRRLLLEDGDAEKCVLPPFATELSWHNGDRQLLMPPHYRPRMLRWTDDYLGPLPSLQDFPHDGDTVSLDEVREMVKGAANG